MPSLIKYHPNHVSIPAPSPQPYPALEAVRRPVTGYDFYTAGEGYFDW